MPSTSCRPCSGWPRSSCRTPSTASLRARWTARAWLTCCRLAAGRRRNGTRRSTSRCSAPVRSTTSGWKAVTFHPVGPLYDDQNPNAPFDDDVWELYHVADDLSESRDLAQQRPGLLAELIELWWARGGAQPGAAAGQPGAVGAGQPEAGPPRAARGVPLLPGRRQVPESVAVNVRNRSHALIADIVDARRRPGRRRPAGHGLRAGRLVAAHPERQAAVRAQPVRQGNAIVATVGRARRPRRRITSSSTFTKDDGLGGIGVLSCDGSEVARRQHPAVHAIWIQWRRRRPDLRIRVGASRRDGLCGAVPVPGKIRYAAVETTGPGRPRSDGRA